MTVQHERRYPTHHQPRETWQWKCRKSEKTEIDSRSRHERAASGLASAPACTHSTTQKTASPASTSPATTNSLQLARPSHTFEFGAWTVKQLLRMTALSLKPLIA